ncbi:TPA: hypothetical protein [Aquificae Joseph's Coat Spring virus]|nr:TPA: hypothetical protein [Aquificae Joseph's Coat Spring virus]
MRLTETISVFLTEEMADMLYSIAYMYKKPVSKLVRELIEDYLLNTIPNSEESKYERYQVPIYTERIRVGLTPDLKKALFQRAREEKTEMSKLIRDIIKEYLKTLELNIPLIKVSQTF